MIYTYICTAQAVPVYLAEPEHEPQTENRYQEAVVDNVVVRHPLQLLYIVLTTTTWQKYRILEIVGIPTIFRYTDSGGSPGGNSSPLMVKAPSCDLCCDSLQHKLCSRPLNGIQTSGLYGTYNCVSLWQSVCIFNHTFVRLPNLSLFEDTPCYVS